MSFEVLVSLLLSVAWLVLLVMNVGLKARNKALLRQVDIYQAHIKAHNINTGK